MLTYAHSGFFFFISRPKSSNCQIALETFESKMVFKVEVCSSFITTTVWELYIAFRHSFSFAKYSAACCNQLRFMPEIFPAFAICCFAHYPIWSMQIHSYALFLLRDKWKDLEDWVNDRKIWVSNEINNRKIEWSNESDIGLCHILNKSSKIHFPYEKNMS